MDYEGRYNELVEAARAVVEGNPGLCKIDERLSRLSKLLPEKESEDERIRKSLIRHFENKTKPYWNELAVKDIIAYLERQKDEVQRQFNLGVQAGREEVLYEMEKDQKPTNSEKPKEWSEEDEDRRHDILLTLEALRSSAGSTDTTIVYQHLIDWLKSLRPQPHWKPSEEDLTALEYCAEHTCPELLSLYLELKKL